MILLSTFLTIEIYFCITTECNHIYYLHNKNFVDKNIFFSLVSFVPKKILSTKFILEPVEQLAITIIMLEINNKNIILEKYILK